MKTKLIPMGDDRGIRIPAALIEACGFEDVVDMHVEGNTLVLKAARHPREGWSKAFADAAPREGDRLLLAASPSNTFDDEEWTWESET